MGLRCLAVAAEEVGLGGGRVGRTEGVGSVVLHQFVGDNIITVKLSIIRKRFIFLSTNFKSKIYLSTFLPQDMSPENLPPN